MPKISLWAVLVMFAALLACMEAAPDPGTNGVVNRRHRGNQRDQHHDDAGHVPDVDAHSNHGACGYVGP